MSSAKPVSGGEPTSASMNVSSVPSPSMIVHVGAELEVTAEVEISETKGVAGWSCIGSPFGAVICSDSKGGVAVIGMAMCQWSPVPWSIPALM